MTPEPSADAPRTRWYGATAWTAAAIAWAVAYPAYHLGLALHHQAGWLRGFGTAAAGVGLITATAAVVAGLAVAAGLDRRPAAVAVLRAGFVGLVWGVLALLGLALFWREVAFAPAGSTAAQATRRTWRGSRGRRTFTRAAWPPRTARCA